MNMNLCIRINSRAHQTRLLSSKTICYNKTELFCRTEYRKDFESDGFVSRDIGGNRGWGNKFIFQSIKKHHSYTCKSYETEIHHKSSPEKNECNKIQQAMSWVSAKEKRGITAPFLSMFSGDRRLQACC